MQGSVTTDGEKPRCLTKERYDVEESWKADVRFMLLICTKLRIKVNEGNSQAHSIRKIQHPTI